jgi:hypothetical protein
MHHAQLASDVRVKRCVKTAAYSTNMLWHWIGRKVSAPKAAGFQLACVDLSSVLRIRPAARPHARHQFTALHNHAEVPCIRPKCAGGAQGRVLTSSRSLRSPQTPAYLCCAAEHALVARQLWQRLLQPLLGCCRGCVVGLHQRQRRCRCRGGMWRHRRSACHIPQLIGPLLRCGLQRRRRRSCRHCLCPCCWC